MNQRFIEVQNRAGIKQRVPESWTQEGHQFADRFKKTPSARQREERSSTPDDSWTVPQLRSYAETQGIDLTGITIKADVVSAIHNHEPATDAGEE